MAVALAAISPVVHPSISNGMMGFMRFIYGAPLLSLGLVAGAAAGRGLSTGRRRAAMAAAMLLACALLTLVRTNGISGDAVSDFEWRWTPTAEERLLAGPAEAPRASPARAGGRDATGSRGWRPVRRPPRRLRLPARRRRPRRSAGCGAPSPPPGPASADRTGTASSTTCGSLPIGRRRHPSSCGDGRSDPAGHRLRWRAIASSPRSSAATRRSCRPTAWQPAS